MPENEDTVSPEIYEHISRGALLAGVALSITYAVSGIIIFYEKLPYAGLEWLLFIAAALPAIMGAVLGVHQLWLKWVRYTLSDRHMQVVLLGIVLSAAVACIGYFWLFQFTVGKVFFFPLAQLCVTLVILGYPLTHSHKLSLLSSAVAVTPAFLFFVLAMYGQFANPNFWFGDALLAISYLFSGTLMSLAGSLHHMGTITTSFVRIERIVDVDESEIKSLQKVIESRDSELKKIEKFADNLKDVNLENYKKELHGMEGDPSALMAVKLGASSLVQNVKGSMQEQTVSIREVERLTVKEKMLQQKEADLITREKNISDKLAELTKLSSDATIKEMAIKKKEDALTIREMDVSAKERDLTAKEVNAKNVLKEADAKYEEAKKASESLKERELAVASAKKEIETREANVKSKEDQLMKGSSNLAVQKDGLSAREGSLAKREQELRAREETVMIKDREISSMPLDDMKRMKDEMTVKESDVRNKEGEVSVLRIRLDEAQRSLQARADELRTSKIEYDASLAKLKNKESEIAKKEEELQIQKLKLDARERELAISESEFERKSAGTVPSHARAEERAHKLIERLKMSKEMDERMDAQRADEPSAESPILAPQQPSVPEAQPQSTAQPVQPPIPQPPPATRAASPQPPPQPLRPSLPPFMTPKPKDIPVRPAPVPSVPARDVPLPVREAQRPKDDIDGLFRSALMETRTEATAPRISTGIDRMDELLGGGIPAGTMLILSAEAYIGCDTFIYDLVSNALHNGRPVVYISTRRGVDEVFNSLEKKSPEMADYAATGLIKWIDLFSPAPVRMPFLQHVSTLRLEVTSMTEIFLQVDSRTSSGGLVVVDSSSPLISKGKFEVFVRDVASCIKKTKGVAIFRLEASMHPDQEIENLKNIIHGCISFKKDGAKTLLMAEGVPGAKSGNWIEYRIKDGNIAIGSFSLERIS